VIVLGAVIDERPALLAMVTPDVVRQGIKAGDIIREVATHVDGRGGGRPELAEAGGKNPGGIDNAISAVTEVVTAKAATA
jgi:alanyl-tRNA synthetase